MRRWLCLALGVFVALGAGSAAIADSQSDARKYIEDSEADWVRAEVTGDPSVAQRVLADDYVGVFPDGSIGHKADAVAYFTQENASPSAKLDYVHVRVFGETAIAQGQETDIRPAASPVPSGRLIFTDVWVLIAGRWRIVNSEDQYQPLAKP
ncbi:MAG: nuclear transport factor 2 family protein [Caulobacterales bacterium]